MSTADKTAGIFGPSAEQAAQQEAALNKFYGDKMLSSLGAGAGIGLGATAIYHLLRSLKQPGKKEKKYPGYGSGSPVPAKMASIAPMQTPSPFHNFNPNSQQGGPMGPHLGGLMEQFKPYISRSTSGFAPQPQTGLGGGPAAGPTAMQDMFMKFDASMRGGQAFPPRQPNPPMGQGKVAFDLSKLQETLGGMLPKTMIPFSLPSAPGSSAPSADPHAWRKAWGTAANIGAGALGLYGGKKVVDSVMQAKKKKDLEAEMEAARQDYYSALAGDKSASALDFAFEAVKHANVLETLGGMGSAVVNTPQALRTAYLLAMLGAGGVGAKYMYDKTKDMTVGENLAKAQASRARTKGLPPVWVDPESLAHVKTLAGSHE